MLTYPFTEEQSIRAHEEWGANCGPNALAFALQIPLESVRHAIPGFEEKRYTSPSMMAAALRNLHRDFTPYLTEIVGGTLRPSEESMFQNAPSLVRVQWTGPWTEPGANPKWAYRQSHWIVAWGEKDKRWVFDCNGGVQWFELWKRAIVPLLTEQIKRADGGWYPTHVWKV